MRDSDSKRSDIYFILGDGDRIRERVENLLLRGDLERLSIFSEKLNAAITSLAHQLEVRMDAKVIMSAGDDLLACVDASKYNPDELKVLAHEFWAKVGATISFGVGPTVEGAYLNLRRAKSYSEERIVETGVSR